MARAGLGWCPFAEQVEGVNTFTPEHLANVGFCDHAAGGFYTTLKSADFWNNAGVSTHFGISRKGEICQMVNIFDTAFAQGKLGPVVIWPPYPLVGERNPNLYLISTEHEDWVIGADGKGHAVPGSEWTAAEYAADLKLKRWCIEETLKKGENVLQFNINSLAGHYMFDGVNRAECPGKFWRDSYRQMLWNDLQGGTVEQRQWLYGNEAAGEEVVGNQIWMWHLGVVINKIGDEAGQLPGKRLHNEGGNFVEKEP